MDLFEQKPIKCQMMIDKFNHCKNNQLIKSKNSNNEINIGVCMNYFELVKSCINYEHFSNQ